MPFCEGMRSIKELPEVFGYFFPFGNMPQRDAVKRIRIVRMIHERLQKGIVIRRDKAKDFICFVVEHSIQNKRSYRREDSIEFFRRHFEEANRILIARIPMALHMIIAVVRDWLSGGNVSNCENPDAVDRRRSDAGPDCPIEIFRVAHCFDELCSSTILS